MPTLACAVCAQPFEVIPERMRRSYVPKFCGKACYELGRAPRIGKCEQCGADFRLKLPTSRFCSNKCSQAHRSANHVSTLVTRACQICATEFRVKPGRLKLDGQGQFCSTECFYKGRDNPGMSGKRHSAETLTQMKVARKSEWAERLGPDAAYVGTPERNRHLMRERKRRYSKDPKWNLANRLRHSIHQSLQLYAKTRRRGAFRHLSYTPDDLLAHIQRLLAAQNFCCPICGDSLMAGYDVDHIKPLSTASTEEEVLALFALSNLRPICDDCNRHVKRAKLASDDELRVLAEQKRAQTAAA